MLMIVGMFFRASFCAISIASRTLLFSVPLVAAATGSSFSLGCHRSSGMATRPQAMRRCSRLY